MRPLHLAAIFGYAEIAGLLLDAGADPSARASDGETAADFARHGSHAEVLRVIEEHRRE